MNREELQTQAIKDLSSNHRLVLNWPTSMGKGTMAVKFIKNFTNNGTTAKKILIVVAETAHKKNWKNEFIKFEASTCLSYCKMICYASLKNYANTEWDLIIFDEGHHLGSQLRLSILATLKATNVLVMTATLNNYQISRALDDTFGRFLWSRVTLDNAIKADVLPTPKIFLIPLELDNTVSNQVITQEWGNKKLRKTIFCTYNERWTYLKNKASYPNTKLMIKCTAQQKYDFLSSSVSYYDELYHRTLRGSHKLISLRYGSERKKFLGLLKTNVARRLLKRIGNKRFICFCTNTEQADKLGNESAIHYKKKKIESVIESFNNKEINCIFTVDMLKEGQNLPDIEIGIIIQLSGKERDFIQKFGRAMRAEDPVQYIFYFKNTQDEKYKNIVLEKIDPQYITEISI